MQGLKLSELKEGHIYRCLLSGKNVLVRTITLGTVIDSKTDKPTGNDKGITLDTVSWDCGTLNEHPVNDHQLAEIKEAEYIDSKPIDFESLNNNWRESRPEWANEFDRWAANYLKSMSND